MEDKSKRILKKVFITFLSLVLLVVVIFAVLFIRGFFKTCNNCSLNIPLDSFSDFEPSYGRPLVFMDGRPADIKIGSESVEKIGFYNKLERDVYVNIGLDRCVGRINFVEYCGSDVFKFKTRSLSTYVKANETVSFNLEISSECVDQKKAVPVDTYVCSLIAYECEEDICEKYVNQSILARTQVVLNIIE